MAKLEQSTRSFVIERGVEFEASITQILADILDIDLSKSVAFGNGSASLNIFSKIQLLKELDYTPNKAAEYLTVFIEIRNKFAHVLEIDSFEKYFELKGESAKRKFIDLTVGVLKDNILTIENEEEKLNSCFLALCLRVEAFLKLIHWRTQSKITVESTKDEIVEKIAHFDSEGKHDVPQFIDKLRSLARTIPKETEFLDMLNGFKDGK